MAAIERCRTAALGGRVARCEDCARTCVRLRAAADRVDLTSTSHTRGDQIPIALAAPSRSLRRAVSFLRLIGRLPPEQAVPSISGRRPRTLNVADPNDAIDAM